MLQQVQVDFIMPDHSQQTLLDTEKWVRQKKERYKRIQSKSVSGRYFTIDKYIKTTWLVKKIHFTLNVDEILWTFSRKSEGFISRKGSQNKM